MTASRFGSAIHLWSGDAIKPASNQEITAGQVAQAPDVCATGSSGSWTAISAATSEEPQCRRFCVAGCLRLWAKYMHGSGDNVGSGHAFDTAETLLPANPVDPELPYVVLGDVPLGRWRGAAVTALGSISAIDQLRAALDGLDCTFIRAQAAMHELNSIWRVGHSYRISSVPSNAA